MDQSIKFLVKDEYEIEESFLEELARGDRRAGFFKKSLKFFRDVQNREIQTLSEKQLNWLNEIEGILNDRKQNSKEYSPYVKNSKSSENQDIIKSLDNSKETTSNKTEDIQKIETKKSWFSKLIQKIKDLF